MQVRDVRVEYCKNPIGLDVEKPRFSWKIDSEKQNCLQEAYQIQIAETDSGKCVWNTGKVISDQSVLVEYAGESLQPMTIYQVSVHVWDNQDKKAEAECTFETGLLHPETMEASWITSGFAEEEKACPVFFKDIVLSGKVKKARIYATALGLYQIDLDGKKVGEDCFTPGWTSYYHRVQVQTYDVTGMLETDSVRMEITVADGWYKGPFGFTLRPNI